MPTTSERKSIAKELLEDAYPEATRGNVEPLQKYFHEDYISHTGRHSHHEHGLDALKHEAQEWGKLGSDLVIKVTHELAEGNMVMAMWTAEITATGEHHNKRTGALQPHNKQLKVGGVCVYKITNGKIAEEWRYENIVESMVDAGMMTLSPA
ncbi:MAG TPA: ester cyclase [Chloroflexota bacterium]|nr:ester cyclase [Chloroflexota bacterium]